ncbi:hypothetical protein RUM44_010716 [Polyplax serrata]|uniref:Uncharacterized protein n=1 Tax=Polyplax serrata TaxID=468196 RepID=A0ABR1AMZ8_POLSC
MLGGSASSQTSGAPFRTESDTNRATVWPSPAHQTDLFNRGYEIYSLFPGAAEGGKGLYGPAVKAMHPTNYFQGFRGTQKVPDAFFSTKFTFSSNRTSEFESVPNVVIGSSTKPSTPVGDITTGKESRVNGKSVSNDVVVVKSEADEVNKIQCTDVVDDDCVRSDRGDGSREDLEKRQNGTQQIVTTVQVGQANEPDSTDSRLSQDSQKNEDVQPLVVTTTWTQGLLDLMGNLCLGFDSMGMLKVVIFLLCTRFGYSSASTL